jgi:hypothetical protein
MSLRSSNFLKSKKKANTEHSTAISVFVSVHRFRVQRSGLGKRLKLNPRNPRKNAGFATSLPSAMFHICGDVEAVGFLLQNVYKMAYEDENTTLEPLNL